MLAAFTLKEMLRFLLLISGLLGTMASPMEKDCLWGRQGSGLGSAAINNTKRMQSLGGTVDGKGYFVADERKPWHQAVQHCMENGLELATIDSTQQWQWLENALQSKFLWYILWIGGRESRKISAFQWDDTGLPLNPSVIPDYDTKFLDSEPFHNCLSLYNIPRQSSSTVYGVYPILCNIEHNVLCQSRTPKGI